MSTIHAPSPDPDDHRTVPPKPKPPCAERPNDWDLDVGSPDTWHHAVETCYGCPLFDYCAALAATLTADGQPPRSMIWAGIGYDGSGREIEHLDRYRSGPHERRMPMVIIRQGPEYRREQHSSPLGELRGPVSDTPTPHRRTIVLRRRNRAPYATDEPQTNPFGVKGRSE